VIEELEITLKVAAVRLKVTPVALFRFVPGMLISVPALAAMGSVFTNGPRPVERLNTVPHEPPSCAQWKVPPV
jgi:hypothetical protein